MMMIVAQLLCLIWSNKYTGRIAAVSAPVGRRSVGSNNMSSKNILYFTRNSQQPPPAKMKSRAVGYDVYAPFGHRVLKGFGKPI